jgi:glycosyltransferase involved in cell wall biosynthesis
VDEDCIISDAEAKSISLKKIANKQDGLRVLFAGRLTSGKGVPVLLNAMQELRDSQVNITLDIIGDGDLYAECSRVCQEINSSSVRIRQLESVPYGPTFYDLLKHYHALIVPSVSDEQPRVIYDAYAQGLPVLGSDTAGIRACLETDVTGKLFPPNDSSAIASILCWASSNIDQLAIMGLNAVNKARGLTHREMHRRRWQIIFEYLSNTQTQPS